VFSSGRASAAAEKQIKKHRIGRVRIEGNITKVERKVRRGEVSVRVEVSLMLLDEPGRSIKGVLSGAAAATASRRSRGRGEQEISLASQALEGAVRSAMANAAQALRATATH